MKTRKTFRKTFATIASLGLTLAFLAQPVVAQVNGNGSDNKGQKSVKSAKPGTTITAASYAAELEARKKASAIFNLVTESDPELFLQQWMVERRNFVVTPAKPAREKQEPAKQVIDSTLNTISALLVVEKETPLKLEAWMTDEKCFPCESKRHIGSYYTMKFP